MNGIHDMGGMDGLGPIEPEADEPVFHEPWEGRVLGLLFMGVLGDRSFRYAIENIPAADYLRMPYYQRWFTGLVANLIRDGVITAAELESGRAEPGSAPAVDGADGSEESAGPQESPAQDDVPSPRYSPQQDVRARNLQRRGHIRLPAYVRGRRGTVVRHHGLHRLQDTDTEGYRLSREPQYVYTVKFTSDELWGNRAVAGDVVYVDLWEGYLEPA